MINLHYTKTTDPDFGGFRFFVEHGDLFDVTTYAEAYDLDLSLIESQSIKAANDAAGRLAVGEWLEITHDEGQ